MRLIVVASFVIGFGAIAAASPASAQTDGETRCGADNYVQTYNSLLGRWITDSSKKCAYQANTDTNGLGNRGAVKPSEGDQKCGPDGYILQYSRFGDEWRPTYRRCER